MLARKTPAVGSAAAVQVASVPAFRTRGPERRNRTLFHTQAPASRVGWRPRAAVMKAAA